MNSGEAQGGGRGLASFGRFLGPSGRKSGPRDPSLPDFEFLTAAGDGHIISP